MTPRAISGKDSVYIAAADAAHPFSKYSTTDAGHNEGHSSHITIPRSLLCPDDMLPQLRRGI